MFFPFHTRVYVAVGGTDMRKSINGLSILVAGRLKMDPLSDHLFVFSNHRRNMIKVLYWDRNGFCLYAELGIKTVMSSSRLCRVPNLHPLF
jgi:transposase